MAEARGRGDPEPKDDRPPICPACGVTQGMVLADGEPRFVCLECGFSDGDEESTYRQGQ